MLMYGMVMVLSEVGVSYVKGPVLSVTSESVHCTEQAELQITRWGWNRWSNLQRWMGSASAMLTCSLPAAFDALTVPTAPKVKSFPHGAFLWKKYYLHVKAISIKGWIRSIENYPEEKRGDAEIRR